MTTNSTGSRGPGSRGRSGPGQRGSRPQRRGYGRPSRKKCAFCVNKELKLDYKRVDMLRNYVTERGKIQGRRGTGLCAKHQRRLAVAIKRARHLALLPFTAEHVRRV